MQEDINKKYIMTEEHKRKIGIANKGKKTRLGCKHKKETILKLTTHGMSKNGNEYTVWAQMKDRCSNQNHKFYNRYGGRGIKVCNEWLKFENFYKDMGERPNGKTLDRINNNKGYYKENCKWSTMKEQCRNTRRNKFITYKNQTLCLAEWAEKLGLKRETFWMRLYKYGWSVERVMNK